MRKPIAVSLAAALLLPSSVALAQEADVTVVPNDQFCNLVADDLEACEQALTTLASAGMLPEAFSGLVSQAGAQAPEGVTEESEMPADGEFGVGDTQTTDDAAITLVEVEWGVDGGLLDPDPGMQFVSILVSYEALANGAAYNAFFWGATDADGFSYDQSFFGGNEPSLDSGELREGRKAQGWLTFSVPEAVDWLEFSESKPFGDELYWVVQR